MKIIQDDDGIAFRFLNGSVIFVKRHETHTTKRTVHVVDLAGTAPPALDDRELEDLIYALADYMGLLRQGQVHKDAPSKAKEEI